MIDFNKPVQTRDGRKVRVLCTDMKGAKDSITGLVTRCDGVEQAYSWQCNGRFTYGESGADLINVPDTRVVWVNMYPDNGYGCKEAADACADHDREACVRVEYTVGQFDEEPGGEKGA